MQRDQEIYTYETAGFNGFMLRSMKSNSHALTLKSGISAEANSINFDRTPVAGPVSDTFTVGNVEIRGRPGAIAITDGEEDRAYFGAIEDER